MNFMNDSTSQPRQDEALDIRALFAELLRKRSWVLASMLVSTIGFTIAAYLITPVYRAATVLIPVSSERSSLAETVSSSLGQLGGGLASLAGLNVGSQDPGTQEALGVLRSREFGEQFIVAENLMPQLFASKWDSATQTWNTGLRSVPTIGKAFRYFNKSLRSVITDNKTGLITVQIDWRDRNAAAVWANELVKRVNAEMRKRAISNADASIAFLEKELQTTSVVETREAINRLIETQVKQRMLANVTEQFAFRIVDPAIAPDADDPIKPPKILLLAAGPVVGLSLAVALVLILGLGSSDASRRPGGPRPPI
jgi:uncharacterized protein involved in exopolysaccharide biosynthesis